MKHEHEWERVETNDQVDYWGYASHFEKYKCLECKSIKEVFQTSKTFQQKVYIEENK